MKKFWITAAIALSVLLTGCGQIETGNVGVRTSFGKIQANEEGEGVYVALLSHVDEYTTKETYVTLDNMTPRAKDNLTLKDLDVTVYYKTNPQKVADFAATHAGMSAHFKDEGYMRPGYFLIENLSRGITYDETSKFDSMTLHQNRQALEGAISKALTAQLDKSDAGYFTITRIVIRSITTDPAVEDSIRKSIQVQKDIETATKQVQVKQQEAEAMEKTARALTSNYLQHEYIQAIGRCADNSKCTLIVGGGSSSTMLNIPK